MCFNPDDSKYKTAIPPHYGEGHLHFAFETSKEDYPKWKSHIEEIKDLKQEKAAINLACDELKAEIKVLKQQCTEWEQSEKVHNETINVLENNIKE